LNLGALAAVFKLVCADWHKQEMNNDPLAKRVLRHCCLALTDGRPLILYLMLLAFAGAQAKAQTLGNVVMGDGYVTGIIACPTRQNLFCAMSAGPWHQLGLCAWLGVGRKCDKHD
jgi:hypothetical protein